MLPRCRGALGDVARVLPHLRRWMVPPPAAFPGAIVGGHRLLSADAASTEFGTPSKPRTKPSAPMEAMKMRSLVPETHGLGGAGGIKGSSGRSSTGQPMSTDGSSENNRQKNQDGDLFYTCVVPALRYFYEVHSHLNVHKLYVVPDDGIVPAEIRNFALGKRVDNIRARGDFVKSDSEKLQTLMQLGGDDASQRFVWKSKKWVFEHQIMPCLEYFKVKHGHLIIPRDYVTPVGETQLKPHQRLFALGSVSHDMRNKQKGFYLDQQPGRVKQLDQIGFPWETVSLEKWELRDVPAMNWFKRTYGHLSVPTTFKCPDGVDALKTGLPRIAAGSLFGLRCVQLRKRRAAGLLDARVERKLTQLGFPENLQEAFLRRVVLPSVSYYVQTHGHLKWDTKRQASLYQIPIDTPDVPKFAFGLRLGEVLFGSTRPGPDLFAGSIGLWDGRGCGTTEERLQRFKELEKTVLFALEKFRGENEFVNDDWESGVVETMARVKERCEKE